MKKVSVIVPVYNQLKMTIDCLGDLIKTCGVEIEIILVDDGSKEPISKAVSRMFPQVVVLSNDENLGFAKTVNKGIDRASHDLICLLNNDIRLPNKNWLKMMIEEMHNSGLDMTAPAGGRMNEKTWEYQVGEAKRKGEKYTYLVGWCLVFKREVLDKIGKIPEVMGKGFFEDLLWGLRARKAGLKSGITEGTGVQHLYHQTFKAEGYDLAKEYEKKRKMFLEVWSKEI